MMRSPSSRSSGAGLRLGNRRNRSACVDCVGRSDQVEQSEVGQGDTVGVGDMLEDQSPTVAVDTKLRCAKSPAGMAGATTHRRPRRSPPICN